MSTYEWGIDLAKRNTKCKGKKCFYDNGTITKGTSRIKKSFDTGGFSQQHYFHIDCYLNTTLTQKATTERVTAEKLPEITGWSELDEDLQKKTLKFFQDWEGGDHTIRWDPESVKEEEQEEEQQGEEGEEGQEGEEEKGGKKRKAQKGKAKAPAKKAKKQTDEEKLAEIKDEESEHVYMENTEGTHNKFYEVWTKGANVVTKYGSIPQYSTCPVHIKKVTNAEAAKTEMEKTIKAKTSKGKGYSKASKPSD